MNRITRHRHAVIVAVASLALLAGASSASASLPSLGAQLNAGQLAVDVDSDAIRGQVDGVVAGQVAEAQQRLRSANRSLNRAQRRLRSIERRLRSSASETTSQATQRLNRLHRRTVRRVRSLRGSVRRLSRRVARYAIAEARSAANGSWLVVTRSGRIIEQSGGISVSHLGRGTYRVSWSMNRSDCFQFYGGAPVGGVGSSMHIDPVGVGAMIVHVGAATGPRDLGFYLAAVC